MTNFRKIIHVDMDAFYASIEQRDNPDLKGKPVAVGGNAERGVIAAASYEARKFGVKSAMSSMKAARICPDLIFVPPHFDKYKAASQEIRSIFQRYTDLIEPLALDEAFLDVTDHPMQSATFIAKAIKNDIYESLGLVASAGVSYNKFLAKIASDQDKPDGLFVIAPEEGADFVAQLSVDKFFGVGKVTAQKMKELGIYFGRDLLKFSEQELSTYFGKAGHFFYQIARGIDHRPVKAHRERKSIGAERTLSENILERDEIEFQLKKVVDALWKRYEKAEKKGYTLSIKLKFSDFTQLTRAFTGNKVIQTKAEIWNLSLQLIVENYDRKMPLRLLGVAISNFTDEGDERKEEFVQLSLL
ncbi:DNA polymerase IV [Lishizhenia tianjinensis]|nr:DNA polymerase IV [Lishizhenia tianjinensis]